MRDEKYQGPAGSDQYPAPVYAAPPRAAGQDAYVAPPGYAWPGGIPGQPVHTTPQMHATYFGALPDDRPWPDNRRTADRSGAGYPTPPPVNMDIESQQAMIFADKQVRNGFIRKVFGILALQLAVTVGFAVACFQVGAIRSYVHSTPWPFYLAWGLSFVILLVLSFSDTLRRRHPYNIIMLGLFTLCEAFLVGMITSYFRTDIVMLAFITTCAAVTALALLACQTRVDVTNKGGILLVLLVIFVVLLLIGIFWRSTIFHLVIAGMGALLFSFYLVYDIQLLMGGRSYSMSPDQYVFGALALYIDIVNIFLFVLQIFSFASNQ